MNENEGDSLGGVRAVERAGRIITTLAEHPYPMSLRELAVKVRLSPASVHRMLTSLVRMGWVDQNTRTTRYRLGTRMMGIGSTGLITNPVVSLGRNYLTRLAAITGHDAVLSTLVGARVVHLARVQGANARVWEFEPGVSQPAHAMADGKLLLAYVPTEERLNLYEVEGLGSYTANTIVSSSELERELESIRNHGYAVDRNERFETARGLAVPILGFDDRPILAMLTIGFLEPTTEYEDWLSQQMFGLARELSNQLIVVGDMPRPAVPFARYNLE